MKVEALLAYFVAFAAARGASADATCSRNGDPSPAGAATPCVCDSGWTGPDCSVLDLAPAAAPSDQAYCHFNDSTWGGSAVRDSETGVYHLFFSEMSNNCSLRSYGTVSRIAHATSATPAGPYTRRDVALPVLAHNPQVVRHPDGTYLLFHIGDDFDPACVPNCSSSPAP